MLKCGSYAPNSGEAKFSKLLKYISFPEKFTLSSKTDGCFL